MYLCHILLWHRYIDDVLMLWDGPKELLQTFVQLLNKNVFNLKFTKTCDQKRIYFLEIFVKPDSTLGTTLFCKPTAENTIFKANSGHPSSLVKLIPYGQYL